MKMRIADAGAVRAVVEGDKHILEVLAIPYGGPARPDRLGQWFTPQTDVKLKIGDKRPVLYMHGLSPQGRRMKNPPTIGEFEYVREDAAGKWARVEIDDSELSTRSWQAAVEGRAGASTGAIGYLVQPPFDEDTGKYPPGPVEVWAVAELSVFDRGDKRVPVSDDAVVLPIRAIYDKQGLELPEAFEADEAEEAVEKDAPIDDEEETSMPDEIETPPAVEPEPVVPKEEPARRGLFNIRKETVGEPKGDAGKEESWRWFWHLRHGSLGDKAAMRVLEEHEAAEGLPMVPQAALDSIVAQRDELSVVSRAGFTRYQTDRQIFNIPREATKMTAMALIAEEGAYVVNEPVFALLAITTLKYGSMIGATEELLEDQNLFIPWFTQACGRAWARTENAQFYTTMDVAGNGTVTGAASDTLTLAEWNTYFWALAPEYREGAVLIMNLGTMAALNGLLVATPYALGAYPDAPRGVMGLASTMGTPIHCVNDWIIYTGAAALGLVLSHVNPAFAGIVERRGMNIRVDPYGLAATGIVRYFPSVRFAPFVSQPLAHSVKNGA